MSIRQTSYTIFVALLLLVASPLCLRADVLLNFPGANVGRPDIAAGPGGELYAVVETVVENWLVVYESTDGGETWSYLTGLLNGPLNYRMHNPSIAVGQISSTQHRVFVAYAETQPDTTKTVFVFSFDPDNISNKDLTTIESGIAMSDEIHPEICTDSPIHVGNYSVYLVYNMQVGTIPLHLVRFAHTTHQASFWETPETIALGTFLTRQRPHIAFGGPIGFPGDSYRLFVVFETAEDVGGVSRNDVHLQVSRDYGTNWDDPVVIASGAEDQYDARVAAAAAGTTVEVVYTSNFMNSGDLDIHYAYSTNAGVNWTTNQWLATDNSDEQSPDIAINLNNRFHCAYWQDNDVKYTWTDDANPTYWVTDTAVNTGQTVSSTDTRPTVCALRGGAEDHEASIAWTDTRGPTSDAYFNRSQWPPLYILLPDGSGHYPTIQTAIDSALAGSLVLLGDGTYSGPGNVDIDFKGKNLTILSESGNAEACIIDCQGSPADPHFGFVFASGEGPDSRLEGITIANGYAEVGDEEAVAFAGGITIRQSSPTIRNVRLVDNSSLISGLPIPIPTPDSPLGHAFGGGMACSHEASPTLDGCYFSGNSVTLDLGVSPTVDTEKIAVAGGLALFGCAPNMPAGPTLVGNSASFLETQDYAGDLAVAGGIACSRTTMEITGGAVMQNLATVSEDRGVADAEASVAGGIACIGSTLMAGGCEISDNQVSNDPIPMPLPANSLAGGVALASSSFELADCFFGVNRCEQTGAVALGDSVFMAGAASFVRSSGSVDGCGFHGNASLLGDEDNTFNYAEIAGAIVKWGGELNMATCEIIQNVALLAGGAEQVLGSGGCMITIEGATVTDCTLAENSVTVAGGIGEAVAGGAVGFSEFSSATLNVCRFVANEARVESTTAGGYPGFAVVGGGAACPSSDLVLDGCVFEANRGFVHAPAEVSLAGGMACIDAAPQIIDCLYAGNEAEKNIYCSENCAIAGGLACRNSAPVVVGSTFVGNRGDRLDEGDCGGIACTEGSIPVIENSIIAFSPLGAAVHCDGASSASLVCSNLIGNAGGDWIGCIADQAYANGNLSVAPLFCDADDGEFTLAANSPCLPENNDCGVRIGAFDHGCDWASPVDLVEDLLPTGLNGNYPNPFNPRTTIHFSIERAGYVRLSIHDLAGRRIAVLAADEFPVGGHEAVWDGTNQQGRQVATGVYFARLEVGAVTDTQKLVLLK